MRFRAVSCIGHRGTRTAIFALGVALLSGSCGDRAPPDDPALAIELRWSRSYARESRADVETGLLWALSFLGAALPEKGGDPLSWRGDVVALHLDHAGIDTNLLPRWKRLFGVLKASEEYRANGAFDIGRFVALTLCSPNHYYALTGADPRYEEAYGRHSFGRERAAIVESSVSHGHRLVEIAEGPITDIAFVAHEGTGSVTRDTFVPQEHELLDVMANGQLRFALYDEDGVLKRSADPVLTGAGKPSKCLWCHETHLSRPFSGRTSAPGYLSLAEFERRIADRMQELRASRSKFASRVDFKRAQDHTYAELLYISFYEPSAERVAHEWHMPIAQIREALAGLPTHTHHEFAFLGEQLYRRRDVDDLSPYAVLEPPTDAREPSAYEPDLLR
jgi:hypothetical protein